MRGKQRIIERYSNLVAATLGRLTAARVVDKNASDDLRAQREKVHPILAADAAGAGQLQISLIGQRLRLQTLARRAAAQVPPGNAPQFRIKKRGQTVERHFVAIVPGDEQAADV